MAGLFAIGLLVYDSPLFLLLFLPVSDLLYPSNARLAEMRALLLLLGVLLPLLAAGSPVIPTPPLGSDVCLDSSSLPASVASQLSDVSVSPTSSAKTNLPVFFFHGLTGNSTEGFNYEANLTAEGRVFVALSFCERECSHQALDLQVPMAIAAVRDVVARDDRFKDGYIFIGHSQGGLLARAVIEEMDDHKVHTFVSLAGGQNGIFYGPQPADRAPVGGVREGFGAVVLPSTLFDFTGYSAEGYRGKMQKEFAQRSMDPALQAAYSFANLGRTPVRQVWLDTNTFMPRMNNVNKCAWFDFYCHLEKLRRKSNFLRLKEAHFFASPNDGVAAPWQTSLFGQYNDVNTLEEIESSFESFTMVEMHDTVEYVEDTFGLRTLDERGGLFRYTAPDIPHCCWLYDFPHFDAEGLCEFHPIYDKYVYGVLS
ncbi:hypothetical protein BBJ28_00010284 [Nothophytophthora sp. Chile5]|nr:hypothetical protein BBJ28_00010284 [Nothophytophthora sp. Chile5]